MVVPHEVDHGLLMESNKERLGIDASHGDISALLRMKRKKHCEKGETRNRLAELSRSPLSGFGFFETKLSTGTYNGEKKACIPRQGQDDKDLYWGDGLGRPIAKRFAHGGASLNWGTSSESTAHDDSILLGDCTPSTLYLYESYVSESKKIEARGKAPLAIDRFTRCARPHTELFCLMYGKEHRKERRDTLETMIEIHESQPDLFTIAFLCHAWGAMAYAYISEIKDGTR